MRVCHLAHCDSWMSNAARQGPCAWLSDPNNSIVTPPSLLPVCRSAPSSPSQQRPQHPAPKLPWLSCWVRTVAMERHQGSQPAVGRGSRAATATAAVGAKARRCGRCCHVQPHGCAWVEEGLCVSSAMRALMHCWALRWGMLKTLPLRCVREEVLVACSPWGLCWLSCTCFAYMLNLTPLPASSAVHCQTNEEPSRGIIKPFTCVICCPCWDAGLPRRL
jgi:hypothetical protein